MPAGETRTFNVHGGYAEGPKGSGGGGFSGALGGGTGGGGGGALAEPKRIGEVEAELKHLSQVIEALEQNVQRLFDRVGPILAQVPGGAQETCGAPSRSAPLADCLLAHAVRIERVCETVARTTNRVEL